VFDAATGEALAGAAISIVASDAADAAFPTLLGEPPHSRTDGTFQISGLAPGRYRLSAELGGYATAQRDITLGTQDLNGVVLELERGVALILRVSLPSGVPARSVQVAVLAPDGRQVLRRELFAFESGRVVVDDLGPGTWTVLVSSAGTATREAAVEIPALGAPPLLSINLPAAGGLRLVVPELQSSGRRATLRVYSPNGHLYRQVERFVGLVEQRPMIDGVATVQGVPPGPWLLEVLTAEGERFTGSALVSAHQMSELVLD
jgi:hypothetical protein